MSSHSFRGRTSPYVLFDPTSLGVTCRVLRLISGGRKVLSRKTMVVTRSSSTMTNRIALIGNPVLSGNLVLTGGPFHGAPVLLGNQVLDG